MKILKYQGSNMRQALSQIKSELGDDAMVVSTRDIRRGLLGKGVEISVAIDPDDSDDGGSPSTPRSSGNSSASTRSEFAMNDTDVERIMAPLRSELRSLRSLVKASSDTRTRDELREEMSAIRIAIQGLSDGYSTLAKDNISSDEDEPMESLESLVDKTSIAAPSLGRVIALVGPTGVGKTTTIAKLAANTVYRDHRSAALLTLDTCRVGGETQIRTYADLIGAPLHVVSSPDGLLSKLEDLGDYDKIYIDTAGHSPRDVPAIRILRDAFQGVVDLEVHLTLALPTPRRLIDSNFQRYNEIGIDRLLFTKLDESVDFEELVRTPTRLRVPVSFVTTGQAVPEDLEHVTAISLLELAKHAHLSVEAA